MGAIAQLLQRAHQQRLAAAAGASAPPATPAVTLTPSALPAPVAPSVLPVLNANRNVIPDDTATAGGAPALSLSAAPPPAAIAGAPLDWKALLKKWWPWVVLALLALALVVNVSRPSRRRADG